MSNRIVFIQSFWATIAIAVAGCSSLRQVAIVLTDSSSGKPIEAAFEINRVVDQDLWTFGPFGRTYESDVAHSSVPGNPQYITVGERDVLNVYAPAYEATRLQVCGKTAFVIRGDTENLLQLMIDRTWVDRDVAQRYQVLDDGVVSIPLNPKPPSSSRPAAATGPAS